MLAAAFFVENRRPSLIVGTQSFHWHRQGRYRKNLLETKLKVVVNFHEKVDLCRLRYTPTTGVIWLMNFCHAVIVRHDHGWGHKLTDQQLNHKKKRSLRKWTLTIGLFPFYSVYQLHRKRRKRRKAKSSKVKPASFLRLVDMSGTLAGVSPLPLETAFEAKMAERANTFALCRIVGNDLEPRHKVGQSLANIRFVLDHEPDFEELEKLWLINRIFNTETEARIIALLEERGQIYRRIPFDAEEYQSIGYDFSTFRNLQPFYDGRFEVEAESMHTKRSILQAYRARNNYVMNNNGARNEALELCIEHAKWALPFDGNCFLTDAAWTKLRSDILKSPDMRYFVVPMARMQNNDDLLDASKNFVPNEEPQIAFRSDAPLRFCEHHPYGRRPKVELFLHLGIEGPWQNWVHEDFDTPPREAHAEGHRVGYAGWVARLASGRQHLEVEGQEARKNRWDARSIAIRTTLDMLEARQAVAALANGETLTYHSGAICQAMQNGRADVCSAADEALTREPNLETDNPQSSPSGPMHDCFHPAPRWWLNHKIADVLAYVRRDDERMLGAQHNAVVSEKFEQTRSQRLFSDTTALALASSLPDTDSSYGAHACHNLRMWFIDPETAIAPALTYAQFRIGHQGCTGSLQGLIETKGFYFLLDAVRLLDDAEITEGMLAWCDRFLQWFTESEQRTQERTAHNNHGTCYDLQTAAHAAFLGRVELLQAVNLRAQARALETITPQGDQPYELETRLTQHYCALNLQSWVNLFDLLTAAGLRPWESAAGARIRIGLHRMLSLSTSEWKHQQIKPFDHDRLLPLNETLKNQTGEDVLGSAASEGPVSFHPDNGVAPFWRLTRLGARE